MQRALATGEFPPIELRLLIDGETRWLRSTGAVHMDDQGRAAELFGGVVDITEERQQRRLDEQARTMAFLGLLAGGVAHDFNNLLVAIIGSIELARESDSTEREVLLQQALGACHRAADLAQRLQAFGRKQDARFTLLDLRDVIGQTEALLRRLLDESIALEVALPERPLLVTADWGQLEQALINLCINAQDALAERPSSRLRISAGATVDGHAKLEVEDNGEGIEPRFLSRVFEPFFTTRTGGTGLGLASVHGTVKQHGGDIYVDSEPGRGTRFTIRLRLEEGAPTSGEETRSAPPMPSGGGTVLVAEDDDSVRFLAKPYPPARLLELLRPSPD